MYIFCRYSHINVHDKTCEYIFCTNKAVAEIDLNVQCTSRCVSVMGDQIPSILDRVLKTV